MKKLLETDNIFSILSFKNNLTEDEKKLLTLFHHSKLSEEDFKELIKKLLKIYPFGNYIIDIIYSDILIGYLDGFEENYASLLNEGKEKIRLIKEKMGYP